MFIGRDNELKEIRSAIASNHFESILVYGRRRVGKTELINEALKDSKDLILSYECINSSIIENTKLFTKKIQAKFNNQYLNFNSFEDILNYIFERSINEKIILFIDEFTFLLLDNFKIESVLAMLIDQYKAKSKLKLIISGSYLSLMQKMIEYGSHSYGRFQHILLIRPFNYYDSSKFYQNYSPADKLLMYSIFGGIPFFNSLIDPSISPLDNIFNLIIKRDSILEHEINEMILMETNKISNMNYVISLIVRGIKKYSDIENNLRMNGYSKPDYILNKLIDMDILKKIFPINNESNKKKLFYKLNDNLIHFYYTFLFNSPYQEFRSNPKFFYDNFIKDDLFKTYLPKKFEDVSKEYLIKSNLEYKINPIILKIGTYFYNDAKSKTNREFDIVTLDKLGYISYECKYTNSKINNKIITEELNQTDNLDIIFYKLGFISKEGFENDVDRNKYNCISLDDFYNS